MKSILMAVMLATLCFNAFANKKESIADKIEALKQQAVLLHKDLAELENDLIYPSTTQIAVYLSNQSKEELRVAHLSLMVDGKKVTDHIYTKDHNDALILGGMQRLFMGNLSVGEHEFIAIVKLVNNENKVTQISIESSHYKDSQPLSLGLILKDVEKESDTKKLKSPQLSLVRL